MKLYHNTNATAAKSILEDGMIYAGGKEISLTESEIENRSHDAGAQFSRDSSDCVCLSLYGNPRFGDVAIEVNVSPADAKMEFWNGDFWDPDSEKFSTYDECVGNCMEEGISPYCIEVRYFGDIIVEGEHKAPPINQEVREMKELSVNGRIVQLNNESKDAVLTPTMAREAMCILNGNSKFSATVLDVAGRKGYKLTARTCRPLTAEQLFDAGCDL